jgi:NADH-quinone oxidoreductase subunit L
MLLPLVVLAVPTLLFGFTGLQAEWFPTWSLPEATQVVAPAALLPQTTTTVVSLVLVVVGAGVVLLRWRPGTGTAGPDAAAAWRDPVPSSASWVRAARAGFGMDVVYDRVTVRPFQALSRAVSLVDDRVVVGGLDRTGAAATAAGRAASAGTPRSVQRGLSVALAALVVVLVVVAVLAGGR